MKTTTCNIAIGLNPHWVESMNVGREDRLRQVADILKALCDHAKPERAEVRDGEVVLADFRHARPENDKFFPMSNIVIDVTSALQAFRVLAEAKWPALDKEAWEPAVGFRCIDIREALH